MSHSTLDSDSSSNYQLIFDSALNAYKKKTGKDLQFDPLFRTLENCNSPSAIIDVLRQQIPAIDPSGSSNGRLTNWLNPTVNVLCALSTTISHVVSPAYPPARIIFTGIGSLLSAAQAVCASQGVLVDLFERIENFLRRLEVYIKLPATGGMADIIVKVMVEVLLILALATREIKQGKLSNLLLDDILYVLIYHSSEKFLKRLEGKSDIKDALQRLDKLTQEENRTAAAQDLRATCDVAEGVKNVENDVHDIHYRVKGVDDKMDIVVDGGEKMSGKLQQLANDMGDQNRNQLRQDLAKWLSPPDPSVNYNTACDARHEGTAVWFIESSTFENWKDSSGLLWIYGKRPVFTAGSGKSVLTYVVPQLVLTRRAHTVHLSSSAIIQGIRTISSAGSGHLAFFFFDFKDTGKQDARALLSSLIVQLSNQSDSFYDILLGFHSAHQGGTQQPSVGALTQCLEEMLTVPGEVPIYLIVDALDECPQAREIGHSEFTPLHYESS
ncbi:hypothetical protein BC827DRAFT_1156957 [Russula dissimulans]|nr:hypothetical protein BC827DRAFT_1156957 [Russula dissimulans]